jgi:hypothetical protein
MQVKHPDVLQDAQLAVMSAQAMQPIPFRIKLLRQLVQAVAIHVLQFVGHAVHPAVLLSIVFT